MDFSVTDPSSLRVLTRTVQVASKLCDYVQFTGHPPSLHFRLLTPTHSTFALFRFHASFFPSLTLPPSTACYKLSSKILPPLLKSPQTICSIHMSAHGDGSRLCLTLVTQGGLTKRFLIPLLEGRISSVRTSALRNRLHTTASFLHTLLANFHAKLDEITLIPAASSLALLSFVDDTANPANAFLRTEIKIDATQFDEYVFTTGAESFANLTFLCRPLRFVVEYCDALDVPVKISYDKPSCPLQLEIALPNPAGQPFFDALFIFASRIPPQLAHGTQQQQLHQQQHQLPATATAPVQQQQAQHHNSPTPPPPVPAAPAAPAAPPPVPVAPAPPQQSQPMAVDALRRPLMQQQQQQQHSQQNTQPPSQQQRQVTVGNVPVTPRRHGQQPLIPFASQPLDVPEEEEEDDGQQQRQQHQQQYVRQSLRPVADIQSPTPQQQHTITRSPPTPPPNPSGLANAPPVPESDRMVSIPDSDPWRNRQEDLSPIPESDPSRARRRELTPIPESDPSRSRRRNMTPIPESDPSRSRRRNMTPIQESDPSTVQPTPAPPSDSQYRHSDDYDDEDEDEFEDGSAEDEEQTPRDGEYSFVDDDEDDDEEEDEFVDGTPPPEATQG